MSYRAVFVLLLFALLVADRAFFVAAQLRIDDYGIRGQLMDGQLVLNRVPETDDLGQPLPFAEAGAKPGDRLLALYDAEGRGGRIESLGDFGDVRRRLHAGEPCVAVVLRPRKQAEPQLLTLDVPPPPSSQWGWTRSALEVGFQLWLPLLAAFTAVFLGVLRPRDDLAFLASLMFFCFASIFLEPPLLRPTGLREAVLLVRDVSGRLAGYLLMLFFLRFPTPSPIDQRLPWLKRVLLLPVLLFIVFGTARSVSAYWSFAAYERIDGLLAELGIGFLLQNLEFPLSAAMITLGVASLGVNAKRASSERDRRRLELLQIGAGVGLVPLFALSLLNYLQWERPDWFVAVVMLLVGAFPLSFIYVVVRHRVFGIRLIIRRGLQYALLSRGVLVAEAFVLFVALTIGVTPLITDRTPLPQELVPVGTAIVAVGLGLGLRSVNRRLLPIIDRRFFRDEYDARRLLMDLSRGARRLVAQPNELLDMVSEQILRSLHPNQIALFLADDPWTFLAARGTSGSRDDRPEPGAFRIYMHRLEPSLRPAGVDALPNSGLARDLEDVPSPFVDGNPAGETRSGRSPDVLDLDPESLATRLHEKDAIPESWSMLRAAYDARIVVPLVAGDALLGFLTLGEKLSEEPYSREDRELLLAVTEQVSVALDYARLVGRVAEQERLEREVEIAKSVQGHLFPQELPPIPNLLYTGSCRPARGVGGDYFDFIKLDDERLVIALGDISGKGISAALLMASLQGALRGHVSMREQDLVGLVQDLNRLMCRSSDPGKFATFFCGLFDGATRELTYVNAGHLPPILVHDGESSADSGADGSEPPRTTRLDPGGLVIGLLEDSDYEAGRVRIDPGDTLLLFTDGVTDAERSDGEMFDEWRLVELVQRDRSLEPDALRQRIEDALDEFVGDAEQMDDITLIVARGA
jgi:sigma-B regulation protein RsbU (phosphoserine phosphatase)